MTIADALKDSESTEIKNDFPENQSENGFSGYNQKRKRQPMLTEKGKWYRLTQNITERKKPYQGNLNTNGKDRNTYMNLHKNVELVNAEVLKLNERFNVF